MEISNITKQQPRVIKWLLIFFIFAELLFAFGYWDARREKKEHVNEGLIWIHKLSSYKGAAQDARVIALVTKKETIKFVCHHGGKVSCFSNEIMAEIRKQKVIAKWQRRDLIFKQLISVQLKNGRTYKVPEKYYKNKKYFSRMAVRLCIEAFLLFFVALLMRVAGSIDQKNINKVRGAP